MNGGSSPPPSSSVAGATHGPAADLAEDPICDTCGGQPPVTGGSAATAGAAHPADTPATATFVRRRHRARCARQCRRWGRVGSLAVAVCSCGSTALCNLWNFCHRGAFCHLAGGFGPAEADSAFGGSHVCLYAACPRGRRPVTERGQAGQELQELSWALFRRTLHVGGISSPLSVGHSLGRLVPLRNRPGRRTSRPPRPSHVGGKSEAPSCHRGRQQN